MNISRHLNRFFAVGILTAFLPGGIVPCCFSQTDTFVAGSGNWSSTAAWSLGQLPQSFNDCQFLAGGVITDDAAGTCQNVFLASGDSLTIGTSSAPTAYLYVYGSSLTNPGTITLTQNSGLHIIGSTGVVTLSGGGTVNLSASTGISWGGTGETRLVNADNIIQGQGSIGLGTMDLTNQKTIMSSGGLLDIQPAKGGLVNTGLMEANSGSTLQFDAGFQSIPFTNTGGTVEAPSGGTVNINSGTWTGGTFTTAGTGVMNLIVPAMNGVTNTGIMTIPSSGTPTFEGVTTNSGLIEDSGIMYISGNATLANGGGGVVLTGASSRLESLNGTDTLTNQQTISGAGTIYALTVTNQGTISGDNTSAPLILADQSSGATPTTNTGTLIAISGGTLQVENTVHNTGGLIEAQGGSKVLLATGVVDGGTFEALGTGTIQSQNGTLDGRVNTPTISTGSFIVPSGFNLSLEGTIANDATITVDSSSCIDLLQPTTLTGTGKVVLDSGSCIFGSGESFTNQSTVEGSGNIGDSNPMPIVNNGTFLANTKSATLTITPDVSGFTNNGTLSVNSGSTMFINGTFNNFASQTLTGGTYSVSGTLEFPNASIVTNAGSITLTGTAAKILNSSTLGNALGALSSNTSKGSLTLKSAAALSTTTAFTNSGKTTVNSGTSLTVGSSYTQSASTTTVDGTLTAPTGLTVKGGTLQGKGTLSGAVTVSGGTVIVGDSTTKPGILTVAGSYTQSTTSPKLDVAIGGDTVGTQYSQLSVANGIALDGVLTIKLINSFVPTIGSTFTILKGSAVSGTFSTVNGTSINSGEHFQVNYSSNEVTLSVVSGPAEE